MRLHLIVSPRRRARLQFIPTVTTASLHHITSSRDCSRLEYTTSSFCKDSPPLENIPRYSNTATSYTRSSPPNLLPPPQIHQSPSPRAPQRICLAHSMAMAADSSPARSSRPSRIKFSGRPKFNIDDRKSTRRVPGGVSKQRTLFLTRNMLCRRTHLIPSRFHRVIESIRMVCSSCLERLGKS